MTNIQMKDFFDSVVAGAPVDRLDLDRAVAAGRRRRHRRTAATAGSLIATVALVGAVAFTALPRTDSPDTTGAGHPTTSNDPSASTRPSGTPTPSGSVPTTSPVVTVSPGQKLDLGSGSYLTVTPNEKCVYLATPPDPSPLDCKSLTDGNQAPNTLSFQGTSAGQGKPELITGIYTGTDATLITVTYAGVTRAATIVKLGANPKSLVYYLLWPTRFPDGAVMKRQVTFQALDASGRSLANE